MDNFTDTDTAKKEQSARGNRSVLGRYAGSPQPADLATDTDTSEAATLLMSLTEGTIFRYEVPEDCFSYVQVSTDGTAKKREIPAFQLLLRKLAAGENSGRKEFAGAILNAIHKRENGTIEFWEHLFTEVPHWNRMTYRLRLDEHQQVKSLIGCNIILRRISCSAERIQRAEHDKSSGSLLFPREYLEDEINRKQSELNDCEKGMLFLISINNMEEIKASKPDKVSKLLRLIADSVLADSRGQDLLAEIGEGAFALYLSGVLSIDVIERRAHRIVEIVSSAAVSGVANVDCSVGVAASGRTTTEYACLYREAEYALKSAKTHGNNNFRVYERGMEDWI